MHYLDNIIKSISSAFIPILKGTCKEDYVPIDLSVDNPDLLDIAISELNECETYIDKVLSESNATVAYGGYLEKRNLYANNNKFSSREKSARNIHLGVDFWAAAGTEVVTPFDGVVHSFKNNTSFGDYGPTIVLQHQIEDIPFFTLYGHLSMESIADLEIGMCFNKGTILAALGTPDINVGYVPHLHFQLILDIQDYFGDYPGVCALKNLESYKEKCPNPRFLLGL